MAGTKTELKAILELADLASGPVQDEIFQLVFDYLIDGRLLPEDAEYDGALALLGRLRPTVSKDIRAVSAMKLRRRTGVRAEFVAIFLDDENDILMRFLPTVQLAEADWLAVASKAPPAARSLMASRSDLPSSVLQLLRMQTENSWRVGARSAGEGGEASREPIDTVRDGDRPGPLLNIKDIVASISELRWETDRQGRVTYFDADTISGGVTLGAEATAAIIGQIFAELFVADDNRMMLAIERRAPFRDVGAAVSHGALKGRWTLAGVPYFDSLTGRYLGYRGTAQSVTDPAAAPESVPELQAGAREELAPRAYDAVIGGDTLSTMAHEIRTPLNAIMGFAQLIEAQTIGLVPDPYRARAAGILTAAERLLGTIDSVHDMTRLRRGSYRIAKDGFHPARVVEGVLETYRDHARRRGVYLVSRVSTGLHPVEGDSSLIQRVLGRLLVIACDCAQPGETLIVALRRPCVGVIVYSLRRPGVSLARAGSEAVAPAAPETGDVHANRFDLALALTRDLVAELGGTLAVTDDGFTLTLNVTETAAPTPS